MKSYDQEYRQLLKQIREALKDGTAGHQISPEYKGTHQKTQSTGYVLPTTTAFIQLLAKKHGFLSKW